MDKKYVVFRMNTDMEGGEVIETNELMPNDIIMKVLDDEQLSKGNKLD